VMDSAQQLNVAKNSSDSLNPLNNSSSSEFQFTKGDDDLNVNFSFGHSDMSKSAPKSAVKVTSKALDDLNIDPAQISAEAFNKEFSLSFLMQNAEFLRELRERQRRDLWEKEVNDTPVSQTPVFTPGAQISKMRSCIVNFEKDHSEHQPRDDPKSTGIV
jgi:hypothetical protein